MKNKKTLLIDMDQTLVNMLPYWLEDYNALSGEHLTMADLTEYEMRKFVKRPDLLDKALHKKGFFSKLTPMPNAVQYFQKILDDDRFDPVIITLVPRGASHGIEEKRGWMLKYFPNFNLCDMIFCHRKYMVRGDLMFDDNPAFLSSWKEQNPDGILVSIDFPFNRCIEVNHRLNEEDAWEDFYEILQKIA